MKSLIAALQFLTCIRVPVRYEFEPEDFARSVTWFFAAGLLIGSVQWLVASAAMHILRTDVLAVLVVIAGIAATGGLHLDGAADTADGFGAGHDRESVLRIMKDERLGVYGVAAIVLSLYLKIVATKYILDSHQAVVLILAPMISRSLVACTCTTLPYARHEGLGTAFSRGSFLYAVPAFLLCLVFCYATSQLILLPIATAAAVLFNSYCYLRIRGYTGDTLGFLNELIEISVLVAA